MSKNNKIIITGRIKDGLQQAYTYDDYNFYSFTLSSKRTSGTYDDLHVIAGEDLLHLRDGSCVGPFVKVTGEIRTRNQVDENGKNRLLTYLFARTIDIVEDVDNINEVQLIGYICRKPVLRTTPQGRTVCDFMIAVQRQTPGRSDYIPCIAWSKKADEISEVPVGTKVVLCGRMQSRVYHKSTDPRVAYELSINDFDVM